MVTGVYTGALVHLMGKSALLRFPPEEGYVLAQFDDRSLTRSGQVLQTLSLQDEPHSRFQTLQESDSPPADALGYGWHVFKAAEFEVEELLW